MRLLFVYGYEPSGHASAARALEACAKRQGLETVRVNISADYHKILGPFVAKVYTSEELGVARLHCAWIALAAEQFRLQEGRWPQDALELVGRRLLPRLFFDPFDDEPIRLRHAPDGLVVYLVGWRKDYDGKDRDDLSQRSITASEHFEFRLWNPDRRSQPPIPPRRDDPP